MNAFQVPSDRLLELRRLVQQMGEVGTALGLARQVRLVIDTNTVLGDLRYAAKRGLSGFRTSLLELFASGTVVAFAPSDVLSEVEKHLEGIALKARVDHAVARSIWLEYQRHLVVFPAHALDVSGPEHDELRRRDPNDLGFAALQHELGTDGILTRDKDLHATGYPSIEPGEFVIDLRTYARHEAVRATLHLGGGLAIAGSIGAVVTLLQGTIRLLSGLPPWAKFVLAGAVLAVVASPNCRERIRTALAGAKEKLAAEWNRLEPELQSLGKQFEASRTAAESAWERVASRLPASRSVTLRQEIFRTLLELGTPAKPAELAALMYGRKSLTPAERAAVLAELRGDARFVEADGGWALRALLEARDKGS